MHTLCHMNSSILHRLLNLAFPPLTLYLEIILYWRVQIDLILLLVVFFFQFNFVFEIGNTFKRFKTQNHWKRSILRSLTPIPVSPVGVPLPPRASAFVSVSFQRLFVWHSLYFLKCLAILLTSVYVFQFWCFFWWSHKKAAANVLLVRMCEHVCTKNS